jgi:AcrR family transcriptional regulator
MSQRASKRPVGRPRASRRAPTASTEEEILAAARFLFRERGYAATSTRQIAERAGLRQPTLFHYFPSKEAIIAEVALRAVRPVVAFIASERRHNLPPEVALLRLIRFDCRHLCVDDNALGPPHLLPEIGHDRLREFWRQRERVSRRYGDLRRAGARSGAFVVAHAPTVTHLLFSLGESLLLIPPARRRRDAGSLVDVTSRLALRAVLDDPGRFEAISAAADAVDAAADTAEHGGEKP